MSISRLREEIVSSTRLSLNNDPIPHDPSSDDGKIETIYMFLTYFDLAKYEFPESDRIHEIVRNMLIKSTGVDFIYDQDAWASWALENRSKINSEILDDEYIGNVDLRQYLEMLNEYLNAPASV